MYFSKARNARILPQSTHRLVQCCVGSTLPNETTCPRIMYESPISPVLSQVSGKFALELRELTRAIERGEDIDARLRVIREYCHTWSKLAEAVAAQSEARMIRPLAG